METMHIGFMKDLRNIEFQELFYIISHSLSNQEFDNHLLTAAQKRISLHNKELAKMKSKKLRHPLTQVIEEQVHNRTKYLACLRMKVDASILSPDPQEVIAAELLQLWLAPYKKELYPPTINTQNRIVNDLMDDRDLNLEIQEAITLLHLDKLLQTIEEITEQVRKNLLIRLNEKDMYVVNGQEIRKAAYADLKLFIEMLQTIYKLSSDDAEKELLADISSTMNVKFKDFHTILKIRTTKTKNKKKIVAAVKELIGEEQHQRDLPIIIDEELTLNTSERSVKDQWKKITSTGSGT